MTKFYKFLRKDLTHHSFTYTLGLNTDHIPFDTTKDCSPGGLYFASGENIWTFYAFGPKLAIIEIPEDAKVHTEGDKLKASSLIITKIIEDEVEILAEIGRYLIADPKKFMHICTNAAKYGHLKISKFAHNCDRAWGCDNGAKVCERAAENGHLEVLKRAIENGGCNWGDDKGIRVCELAARGGHLEILKYARENGCDWGDGIRICENAAHGGYFEILKYMRESGGCKWNFRYIYRLAKQREHYKMLAQISLLKKESIKC